MNSIRLKTGKLLECIYCNSKIVKKSIMDFISVVFIKLKNIFTEYGNKVKESVNIIIDKMSVVAKTLTSDLGYLLLYFTGYIIQIQRNLMLQNWSITSVFYLDLLLLIMILFGGPILIMINLIISSIMLPVDLGFEIGSIFRYLSVGRQEGDL